MREACGIRQTRDIQRLFGHGCRTVAIRTARNPDSGPAYYEPRTRRLYIRLAFLDYGIEKKALSRMVATSRKCASKSAALNSAINQCGASRSTYRGEGHRLGSRRRESSINQLLAAESKPLRSPRVEENTRTCAVNFDLPKENSKIEDWLAERSEFELAGDFRSGQ
jgi:hypothetical protein